MGVFCFSNALQKQDFNGWVAQLAEQWTENPRVAGSIPAPAISSTPKPMAPVS
jgi:hypothetical protein